MYFGFSNALATFQSMMNNILRDLICIRLVMVYLDDILIFRTCLKEHRQLIKEVLKRLQFDDLYTKAEKYFFEQSSIKYLGIIILESTNGWKETFRSSRVASTNKSQVSTSIFRLCKFLLWVHWELYQDIKTTLWLDQEGLYLELGYETTKCFWGTEKGLYYSFNPKNTKWQWSL